MYGSRMMNFSQDVGDIDGIRFPPGHFHIRATDSITITKVYTGMVQITVSGIGFSCQLHPGAYFTNAMMQQGRTLCDIGPGLCSGASRCPLNTMTVHHKEQVSCTYTCACPAETTDRQRPCEKIIFVFGEGMRSRLGETFIISGINIIWIYKICRISRWAMKDSTVVMKCNESKTVFTCWCESS